MSVVRIPVSFALLAFLLIGCRGEFHQEFDQVQVSLALESDTIEVLDITGVEEIPNPPVDGESVAFSFHPSDGSAVVEGAVRDTRVLRTEFDEEGQPDPKMLVADVGLFDIRVPARAGRLVLKSSTGEPISEVDIDPDGLRTKQMPLLNQNDILSRAVKIVDHGDSSRKADILFLPEGYTQAEMRNFHAHVDAIVAQLKTHQGYKEHWNGFNVWRQDVRSRSTGTGSAGRARDTAFNTATGVAGVQRCVFFADAAGERAARQLGAEIGADATVVLVNSTTSGGCAGDGVVVSARPRWVADVVGHELAHGLFGLADEYETPSASGYCSAGPNVAISAHPDALPWADMLNTDALPTPPTASFGTVGAFEGGGYCSQHRFRPTHNCMMRTLGAGMCPVCRREVARTMEALAPGSGAAEHTVTVTNATGAALWVRCDGESSSTCSDWTFLQNEQAASIRAPGRRLLVHNRDIPAPVSFDFQRGTANSSSVSIYANTSDMFTPPLAGGSSGGGSSAVALTAPTDLVPDGGSWLDHQRVGLYWSPVQAATRYLVKVEVEGGNGWTVHDEQQVTGTSAITYLGSQDLRYRWRVTACSESNCVSSRDALFAYRAPRATEPPVDNTTPDAPPAIPSTQSPADESSVRAGQVTLQWSGTAGSTYNIATKVVDPATNEWRDLPTVTGLTDTRFTANFGTSETWYAWTVQACNSLGCSGWPEFSLVYAAAP